MTEVPDPAVPAALTWRGWLTAAGWGLAAQVAVAVALGWVLPPPWRVPALSAAWFAAFAAWRPGWLAPGERRRTALRAATALAYLAVLAAVRRVRGP